MKKVLLLVAILLSIACSCFAETWYNAGTYDFDYDSIQNVGQNHYQIQVSIRKIEYGRVTAYGLVEFQPRGSNPYYFRALNGQRIARDGRILPLKGFEDFKLASSICNIANIR